MQRENRMKNKQNIKELWDNLKRYVSFEHQKKKKERMAQKIYLKRQGPRTS